MKGDRCRDREAAFLAGRQTELAGSAHTVDAGAFDYNRK